MDNNEKTRENKARRAAKRQGLILQKSRARYTFPYNIDNYGGYRIVDAYTNTIACGEKYDMSLEEIEKYLFEKPEKQLTTNVLTSRRK